MTAYRTMFNHVRKAIDLHDATAHAFRHPYVKSTTKKYLFFLVPR